ncbi:response regulator [Thermoleptolyngbya sp. C42_A2020_037]|uniref:response regulator n=1 Tax=Thermoleptolyngbya sp. C42_A2020_037 TaxID=2747799 RepID=UPI001A04D58C|nr:response regulator [Thermoleptolyngbya sp. C42_A2020_037]MBF2085027.1 response regulator [Thermoleptolyngbya sp. C42_A2020_037]
MNTTSIAGYRFPQKLYPLNLLAQLKSRKTTGCLRVTDGSTTWFIYLEEGDLVYASSSIDSFGRLDRHLSKMSRHLPSLVSAVRVQLRLLFENRPIYQSEFVPDYQAICWLIDQNHLTGEYIFNLIDGLAKEVIEGFLLVNAGSYELLERERFSEWRTFCKIDLRDLADYCQQHVAHQKPQMAIAQTPTFKTIPIERGRSHSTLSQFKDTPEKTAPTEHGSTIGVDQPKLSKEHYTVVCIDDSPTILRSIQAFLDDTMFSVVLISDPVKALMQIVRTKPDLILLDVTMPNLDGYELCSLLRRHPSFRNVPVVMVTSNTGLIDRAKAKLVGASGYLTKPFNQSDLLKVVFKHLS